MYMLFDSKELLESFISFLHDRKTFNLYGALPLRSLLHELIKLSKSPRIGKECLRFAEDVTKQGIHGLFQVRWGTGS